MLIAGLAALVLLFALWYGAVQPLQRAHQNAEDRLAAAVAQRIAIGSATGAAAQDAPAGLDAAAIIARGEAAGLVVTIEGGGADRTRLRIDAARPDLAFTWLAGLEAEQGVRIEEAAVGRREPASVEVRALLSRQ